jgi:hypothetical protein
MTDHIDFDHIARTWLREGPDQLSDDVLDRALEQIHRTSQLGARGFLWRFPDMSPIARVATGFAMVAILAVAGTLLIQRNANVATVASPAPTPPSSPSSSAVASVSLATFDSHRFVYAVDHPVDQAVEPATIDWPDDPLSQPDPFGPGVDRFVLHDGTSWVLISSVALRPGEKALERQASIDQNNAMACTYTRPATAFRLAGADARREELYCFSRDSIVEIVVVYHERVYLLDLFAKGVPLTDADRATFERMLASFRFTSAP